LSAAKCDIPLLLLFSFKSEKPREGEEGNFYLKLILFLAAITSLSSSNLGFEDGFA
jgi:hypothetical protein